MSFLFGFLAFGTLWFWLLMAAVWIIMTVAIESEATGRATWAFVITLVTLQWISHVPVLQWILHHPLDLGLYALGYLLLGTAYSFLKWTLLVYKLRDEMRRKGHWCYGTGYGSNRRDAPQPSEFKNRITGWIMYWPVSGLWTLINDPIRKASQFIYNKCEATFHKISANAFKEFKAAEPKEL